MIRNPTGVCHKTGNSGKLTFTWQAKAPKVLGVCFVLNQNDRAEYDEALTEQSTLYDLHFCAN